MMFSNQSMSMSSISSAGANVLDLERTSTCLLSTNFFYSIWKSNSDTYSHQCIKLPESSVISTIQRKHTLCVRNLICTTIKYGPGFDNSQTMARHALSNTEQFPSSTFSEHDQNPVSCRVPDSLVASDAQPTWTALLSLSTSYHNPGYRSAEIGGDVMVSISIA